MDQVYIHTGHTNYIAKTLWELKVFFLMSVNQLFTEVDIKEMIFKLIS